MPNPITLNDAIAELRQSAKFRVWNQLSVSDLSHLAKSPIDDRHFTPAELAEMWGVSPETIRVLFREEPGVLKIGPNGTKFKRGYKTLRIPQSIAERVYTRLSE